MFNRHTLRQGPSHSTVASSARAAWPRSPRARATRPIAEATRSRVASTKRAAAGSARIWDAPRAAHPQQQPPGRVLSTGGSFVSSNASRASSSQL